eukprot:gene43855-58461_t
MDFQLKTLTVAQAAAEKSDVLIVLVGSAPLTTKDHRPLQFVREFTHISWPTMGQQARPPLRRNHRRLLTVAFADPRQQRVS